MNRNELNDAWKYVIEILSILNHLGNKLAGQKSDFELF